MRCFDTELIRERVPVSELFRRDGRELRRTGTRWYALCPFHDEKSASCHVDDRRGTFFCFGCGAKGDVFGYWEMTRGVGFKEAAGALAELAGMAGFGSGGRDLSDRKDLTDVRDLSGSIGRMDARRGKDAEDGRRPNYQIYPNHQIGGGTLSGGMELGTEHGDGDRTLGRHLIVSGHGSGRGSGRLSGDGLVSGTGMMDGRPAPLEGRSLERWLEGCAFLAGDAEEQARIAEWRGYRVEMVRILAEAGKIGMPRHFGTRRVAFAVEMAIGGCERYDARGERDGAAIGAEAEAEAALVRYHVRVPSRRVEGEWIWQYEPAGIGAWPFVLGDPARCRALVILEGQWDAIAFLDAVASLDAIEVSNRTAIASDEGAGLVEVETQGFVGLPDGLAVMGVRGATSWRRALSWSWPEEAQVFLWSDGDEAGLSWFAEGGFADALRARCRALHGFSWSEGCKDFNDAHRAAVADREGWREALLGMLRRSWRAGLRKRKRKLAAKGGLE